MKTTVTQVLSPDQTDKLLNILKSRFEKNMSRHQSLKWEKLQVKLKANPEKLWSLYKMEETGGEPDVIGYEANSDKYIFFDCSAESPKGRRSISYDHEAMQTRKEHKPINNAEDMAREMGIDILNEEQYRELQKHGTFDQKTSSWILTPANIRSLGGALFADFRYGHVFVYHNGAQSYYGSRGFRGMLRV